MKKIFYITFTIILLFGVEVLGNILFREKDEALAEEFPNFMKFEEPTVELVAEAIQYYDLQHPKIVLAQSIYETGWFKSKVCRERNNLFGIIDPKTGKYKRHLNWWESVEEYKNKIQYKYKGGDYYVFLNRIKYATSSKYISEIKKMEKHINNNFEKFN